MVGLSLAGRPWSVLDGMAVTDLVATACDTAGQLPAPHALVVVDDVARRLAGTADRQRLASPRLRDAVRERLAVALDAFPCPATARARSALRWADPAADSAPESALRGHLLEAGLPPPLANARFTGASGRRYYVDLSWPEIGLGVEVDGRVKYTDMAVVYREKLRQDDLQAAGLRIRRWAAADVAAFPAAVVAAIGRLLS